MTVLRESRWNIEGLKDIDARRVLYSCVAVRVSVYMNAAFVRVDVRTCVRARARLYMFAYMCISVFLRSRRQ